LTAIIEREDDGFVSLCPELDIASQGSSVEEARANLVEALSLFFETADPSEVDRRLRSEVFVTQVEVRGEGATRAVRVTATAPRRNRCKLDSWRSGSFKSSPTRTGSRPGVIVPIELWREIESERETAYLLRSEAMRNRLLAAK
jgi:predicted RNase H-like HicB family nuclease